MMVILSGGTATNRRRPASASLISHRPARGLVWSLLVVAIAAMIAGPCHAQTRPAFQPKPANIDRNGVLILIRSSLLALDQANKTGNYTVLRDLGAPGFQVNSAARLGEIFAKLRGDKIDLSGVAVIDPQLSLMPQIEGDGLMHMTGFFPSVPSQVNFDLSYAPVNGQWRLFGISVGLGSSAPVAPQPSQPPPSSDASKQSQTSAAKPSTPPPWPAPAKPPPAAK